MPADMEICHFVPVEEFWDDAHNYFSEEKQDISNLLLGTEVIFELVGGSSVPGCLTKKDVDIQLRTTRNDFSLVVERMKTYAKVKNLDLWTADKAIFKSIDKKFPTDYLVTVLNTPSDRNYYEARDLLLNSPAILQKYNDLKKAFEGRTYKEYRVEKTAFWQSVFPGYDQTA